MNIVSYFIGTLGIFTLVSVVILLWVIQLRKRRGKQKHTVNWHLSQTGSWLWTLVFLILATGTCVLSCYILGQQVIFTLNASPIVDARIVSYTFSSRKGGVHYRPVVSFKTQEGIDATGKALSRIDERPQIGVQTKIHYNMRNPTQIELVGARGNWFMGIIWMIFSAIFFINVVLWSPPFNRRRS